MEGLVSKVLPTKEIEFMLAGWDESHSGGKKVTFWVADDDEFAYFKNATVRKGKVAGQRYAAVLVQLTDDEQPDPESVKPLPVAKIVVEKATEFKTPDQIAYEILTDPKNADAVAKEAAKRAPATEAQRKAMSGLCGLAIKWCDDEHFQEWLAFTFAEKWGDLAEERANVSHAGLAALLVKQLCRIESRKELDTSEQARRLFDTLIRQPYAACRKADGKAD